MVDAGDESSDSQEDGGNSRGDLAQRLTPAQLEHENEVLKAWNQKLKETIVKMELDHSSEIINLQNRHRGHLLELRQQLSGEDYGLDT
ncbi:hypothetical protein PG988_013716 [Apiospora saccharicola]